MEAIREHKNILAGVIAAAGAIANFTPIPEWAAWVALGFMLAAAFYLLIDAYRIRTRVMAEAKKRRPNAESELMEQAAVTFVITDLITPGR